MTPPRLPPNQLRVIRSYRLKPETAAAIEEMAQDVDLSQGALLDSIIEWFIKTHEGPL